MSLFGKLLAVMNLLGALGLVYLASVDYAARQQWAYVVFMYERQVNGLPVDDKETDKQGQPLVDHLSDASLADLFKNVGGNPVRTAVAEVEAVKGKIDSRVKALEGNRREQAFTLADILLPLSDSLLERDQYLATQAHLSSDASQKALEARYRAGFADATRPGAAGPDRPFAQAFRLGVRSQGGAPSEAITTLIVESLPADPKKANIDKLLADALETQRQGMLKRLEYHFDDALTDADKALAAPPNAPKNSRASQKAAIARVLFGLAPALANADILAAQPRPAPFDKLQPGNPAWVRALANAPQLKQYQRRVFVVCGVKTALDAISARASTQRLLASQVDAAASDEKILFLSDDSALLEDAKEQASRVREEGDRIVDNVRKLAAQRATLTLRRKDVAEAQAALKDSIAETDKAIAKLRTETERARAARVSARNLIGTLAEKEQLIRELERQVSEAEAKSR